MNPKVKKMWLEALRSGKYRQGKEHLRTDAGRYCCLGVLSRLAIDEGVANEDTRGYYLEHHEVSWEDGMLCDVIAKWAKLLYSDQVALADLNDSGATFEQIALCIENGL